MIQNQPIFTDLRIEKDDLLIHINGLHLPDHADIGISKGWSVSTHFHTNYEFHLLCGGSAEVFTDRKYTLRDGEFLLIPPNCVHHADCDSREVLHLTFSFSIEQIPKKPGGTGISYTYYKTLLDQVQNAVILPANPAVRACAGQIFAWANRDQPKPDLLLDTLRTTVFTECMEILREHLPDFEPVRKESADESDEDSRRFLLIDTFVSDRYMTDASYKELGKLLHLSRSQCAVVVKRLTGTTLHRLILKQRMTTARHFLRTSALPSEKIAENVGFRSYSGFFTAYREYFGVTPDADRENTASEL